VNRAVKPPWYCPLCGQAAAHTQEHVLTNWFRKQIPDDARVHINGEPFQRSIIVRVCSDCNGWMNQKLEIPARKTLEALHHSNSIVLRADDQALLAAYMTKHMLMINLWSKAPTDPTFDTRMYRRFRVTMKPPAYTRIWVGVIKDADTEREQQITGVLPETRDLGDGVKLMFPRGSSCHISTFYELLVLWERVPRRNGRSSAERLVRKTADAGLISRIWPPAHRELNWPPETAFDVIAEQRWAQRFGTFP
jgi:hypothetical protein